MSDRKPNTEAVTLAERECARQDMSFAEVFRRHFVISRDARSVPADWKTVQAGGWTAQHCPDLDSCLLEDGEGQAIGLTLGIAITPEGALLKDRHRFAGAVGHRAVQEAEILAERLAGRFILLLASVGHERLYVDPACSFVTYYDPDSRAIASAVGLCLTRDLEENAEVPISRVLSGEAHYFYGATADARARRMLANHYLDLTTFDLHRHWPAEGDSFEHPEDTGELLSEIASKLTLNVETLVGGMKCALPVTGGGDSRLLLIGARHVLDRVGSFFCHVNNGASDVDSLLAIAIAERLNVPLQLVSFRSPRFADKFDKHALEWFRKANLLRSSWQYVPDDRTLVAHEMAPAADAVLRGGVAEMTRANKWPKKELPVTPENCFAALARPRVLTPDFASYSLEGYRRWMEGVPESAMKRVNDLAHTELWLPTTAHVGYSVFARHHYLNPFNDRRLIHLTSCLSPKMRKNSRPQRFILRTYMPELMDIPYKGTEFMRRFKAAGGREVIMPTIGRT